MTRGRPRRNLSAASWRVLFVLLAMTLLAAAACERSRDDLTSREVTHLLASESLARDLDFRFTDADRQRLEALSVTEGEVLLREPERGRAARFRVPIVYPLLTAPAVLVASARGAAIVNALLLAVAAILTAGKLEDRMGSRAPVAVALFIFCSVIYRYTFVIEPAILLLTAVVVALWFAYGFEEPATHALREVYRRPQSGASFAIRWLIVGALLGVAVAHHPVSLPLVAPAAAAVPADRRRAGLVALSLGVVSMPASWLLLSGEIWDGLVGMAGFGAAAVWPPSVALTTWNLLYLLVGRNVGLVPYFLPMVLVLGLWRGGERRSALIVAVLMSMVLLVLLLPFDFFGGPAAVANRWLVPVVAALWFVPTRPLPKGWIVIAVALAAPFMYPTWSAPNVDLLTPDGVYRQASGRFHHWLPVETTQRNLPPAGESSGDRLWVRSLSLEATVAGRGRWKLRGRGVAELQLATPKALRSVYLQFGRQAEPRLEVQGGELGNMVLLADGGVGFDVGKLKRRALHPMWWDRDRHHNYVLRIHMPMADVRPQTLSITAFAEDVRKAEP